MKRRSHTHISKQILTDGKVEVKYGKQVKKFIDEHFADIFIADVTVREFERKLDYIKNTEPPEPDCEMMIGGKRVLLS
jgi:DNA topoisomerase IA